MLLIPCHPLGLLVASQGVLWRPNPLWRLVPPSVGMSILRNLISNTASITISVITCIAKCIFQVPVENQALVLLSGAARRGVVLSSDSSPTSSPSSFREEPCLDFCSARNWTCVCSAILQGSCSDLDKFVLPFSQPQTMLLLKRISKHTILTMPRLPPTRSFLFITSSDFKPP